MDKFFVKRRESNPQDIVKHLREILSRVYLDTMQCDACKWVDSVKEKWYCCECGQEYYCKKCYSLKTVEKMYCSEGCIDYEQWLWTEKHG